jgi:hypothetical protein
MLPCLRALRVLRGKNEVLKEGTSHHEAHEEHEGFTESEFWKASSRTEIARLNISHFLLLNAEP